MRKIEIDSNLVIYKKRYKNKYISQIKKLWLESFKEDDSEYFDYFYKNYFKYLNKNLYFSSKGELVFMFFYSKYELNNHKALFVQGVATDQNYKRKGIMKKCLKYFIFKNNRKRIFFQAYNWDIYSSLITRPVSTYNLFKLATKIGIAAKESDSIIINSDYSSSTKHKKNILSLYKHIGASTYTYNNNYMTVFNDQVIDHNFTDMIELSKVCFYVNPSIKLRDYYKREKIEGFILLNKEVIDTSEFLTNNTEIQENIKLIYII
jgi:hypothetical protein